MASSIYRRSFLQRLWIINNQPIFQKIVLLDGNAVKKCRNRGAKLLLRWAWQFITLLVVAILQRDRTHRLGSNITNFIDI
ncbi:hypothetical protein NL30_29090 [Burkholderia contaminans]|nr:hypothetical protein NL30_29090 [Burkholderia contaminans]